MAHDAKIASEPGVELAKMLLANAIEMFLTANV